MTYQDSRCQLAFMKRSKTRTCRIWQGATNEKGYGVLSVDGKTWKAHRYAWTLYRGPIPDGMCVLHKCDVRSCVRVRHLFLGTRADNNADMHAKGRGKSGPSSKEQTSYERGENHHNAKLTEEGVRYIRSAVEGGKPMSEVARELGFGVPHISKIVNRQAWKHVE